MRNNMNDIGKMVILVMEDARPRLQRVFDIPKDEEMVVYMFPQIWGNTAIGFGGIAGQAFTTAYTIVVYGPKEDVCVYFGGRFAYYIKITNDVFDQDMSNNKMKKVADHELYEENKNEE